MSPPAILWEGQPDPSVRMRDLFTRQTVIGLAGTAILAAVFWNIWGTEFLPARIFALLLACFMLPILLFFAFWVVTSAIQRRQTRYRLTDEGAEIITSVFGFTSTSLTPWDLMNTLALKDGDPGTVTLRRGFDDYQITRYLTAPRHGARKRGLAVQREWTFERIPDARAVHRLISRERIRHMN